jgi:photosystem II stability/assembly factor-like uncharacterized protein
MRSHILLALLVASCGIVSAQNIWHPASGPLADGAGVPAGIAIGADGRVFAAYAPSAYATGGIWRSIDGTRGWTRIDSSLARSPIHAIMLDTLGVLLVAVDSGIVRSSDEGVSWHSASGGLPSGTVVVLTGSATGDMYAAMLPHAVYRSSDHGATWQATGSIDSTPTCVLANQWGDVFVGTLKGIVRSTDRGATWTEVDSGIYSFDISCIAESRLGRLYVGTHGGDVYRSADFGLTWQLAHSGLPEGAVEALCVHPTSDLFASIGGQIYLSGSEGRGWMQIAVVDAPAVTMRSAPSGLMYAQMNGNLAVSSDNGAHWPSVDLIAPTIVALPTTDTIWASMPSGFYRTTTHGATWDFLNARAPALVGGTPAGALLAVDTKTGHGLFRSFEHNWRWDTVVVAASHIGTRIYSGPSGVFFAAGDSLFRCDDSAMNCVTLPLGPSIVTLRAIGVGANGALIAATDNGELRRSSDAGATWVTIANSPGLVDDIVYDGMGKFFVRPFTTNACMMYVTKDNGETWAPACPPSAGGDVHLMVNRRGEVIVGMRGSLFLTGSEGKWWTDLGETAPGDQRQFTPVGVDVDNRVYITIDSMLYQSTEAIAAVGEGARSIVRSMRIDQPFPHPLSSQSNIVQIPITAFHNGTAIVTICDIVGREISRADIRIDAGAHTITLDHAAMHAGTYVVRVACGGEVMSRIFVVE